jgi:hypothetical protein
MAENPLGIQIPANAQGNVNCVADATSFQRVTLALPGQTIILQGTGVGVPMQTPEGRTSPGLPASSAGYELTARFDFSHSGPSGPFEPSETGPPVAIPRPPFTIVQATGHDPDTNEETDALLTLVLVEDDGAAAALAEAARLILSAKTYYDDPSVHGGDEHSIDVVQCGAEQNGHASWRGIGWTAKSTAVWGEEKMFGGYLNVFVQLVDCVWPGLEEAILTLSGQLAFWGSSWPTGYRSTEWTANLANSRYRVTRVTN